jgi:hypothetical protein
MATEKERLALAKEIEAIEAKITDKGKLHHMTQKKLNRLKKDQAKIDKDIYNIRTSEESIQKRINDSLKQQKGFYPGMLKSVLSLNAGSAAELLNRRALGKLQEKQAEKQQGFAKLLQDDAKNGKITIGDRKKLLAIQEGIASGKIKENDIAGKLKSLSTIGLKNSKEYSDTLTGQAKGQANISKAIRYRCFWYGKAAR